MNKGVVPLMLLGGAALALIVLVASLTSPETGLSPIEANIVAWVDDGESYMILGSPESFQNTENREYQVVLLVSNDIGFEAGAVFDCTNVVSSMYYENQGTGPDVVLDIGCDITGSQGGKWVSNGRSKFLMVAKDITDTEKQYDVLFETVEILKEGGCVDKYFRQIECP